MSAANRSRKRGGTTTVTLLLIAAIWVAVILDVNVWSHLTGAMVTIELGVAAFITIALTYLAATK